MDALLTDGNERAALAAARSLRQAGFEVGVAAARRFSLAGVSRGVRRLQLTTDPLTEPAAYAAEIGALTRRLDARVLLPVTDASVEAVLAGARHIPPGVGLPFPDVETYRKASDKAAMLESARRAGLAVPETVLLEQVDAALPDAGFFPAVLKPHRSVVGRRHLAVAFVNSREQCRAALAALPAAAFPVLLQRRVRGRGEGLFVLRWNGRVVAEFAHRRLREKPPEGGVSVYRESIVLDRALVEAGRRLLEELNWQGVAMIECKRDDETGRHVFMEVNGRLWGSLQLAIDAGVDFPALLLDCALGRSVPAVTDYRVGVRSRWFWGDVDHLYLQLRNGGGAAGKLAALRDFLRLGPGRGRNREEVWRWRDPAPFLLESLQQLGIARTTTAPVVAAPQPARSSSGATRMPLSDALALGPDVWEGIQARAAAPSPFMSWAWHRALADSASDSGASQALVLRGAGSAAEAILPVQRRRVLFHRVPVTALTWAIGDAGCPDHLDVLAPPGADIGALVPLLEELDWQILVLSNLTPDAPGAGRLCEAMAARGYVCQRRPLWACPYLDLSDDWESYLASLSAKRRQALRYMERNLKRHHAVAITDYDGDRVDEGWRHLVTLHERRWGDGGAAGRGGAGAFRDPGIDRLHRRFAAEQSRRGQLWLTTLDLDGEPAAAWYGFTCHDTVYFYQCGRDPRWERESVGQVLIGAMIRRAMERGYRRFDFLRGEDPYKRQWTQTQRTTEEVTIFRGGWRGRWLRGLDAAAELRARFRKPNTADPE